jgi:type II secretory pathway predicted ATPase ExeA
MLKLKQRLGEAKIRTVQLATALGYAYPIVCNALNHGTLPVRRDFKGDVEQFLTQQGICAEGIWEEAATSPQMQFQTTNMTDVSDLEAEMLPQHARMLSQHALKHFKLFRDPFRGRLKNADEVYLNYALRLVYRQMEYEASNQGMIAVIGDSGSGKTELRRLLIDKLAEDDEVTVIMPRLVYKSRITVASLYDAIIADLSEENPRRSLEAKARQVERLLIERNQMGRKHAIIIEEAHDLPTPLFKHLKRLWEIGDGFDQHIAIVILGQNELHKRFNEAQNPTIREFTRRCCIAEVEPIGDDLQNYLEHKFQCVGSSADKIFAKDAYAALTKKLRGKHGREPTLLNYHGAVINAMELAAEDSESRVTAEIVEAS